MSMDRSELFRGTSTLTPVASSRTKSAVLPARSNQTFYKGNGYNKDFCQTDMYAFAFYSVALTDLELRQMFRFLGVSPQFSV